MDEVRKPINSTSTNIYDGRIFEPPVILHLQVSLRPTGTNTSKYSSELCWPMLVGDVYSVNIHLVGPLTVSAVLVTSHIVMAASSGRKRCPWVCFPGDNTMILFSVKSQCARHVKTEYVIYIQADFERENRWPQTFISQHTKFCGIAWCNNFLASHL
jgi:hypothetical protein